MIKLENVSSLDLVSNVVMVENGRYSFAMRKRFDDYCVCSELKDLNSTLESKVLSKDDLDYFLRVQAPFIKRAYLFDNVQEVKEALISDEVLCRSGQIDGHYLTWMVSRAEREINMANEKGLESLIYDVQQYDVQNRVLLYNDLNVLSNVLVTDPLQGNASYFRVLRYLSMYELKHLLSHSDGMGNNLLAKRRGMTSEAVEEILAGLVLYDDQLKRQMKELRGSGATSLVFDLNREKKKVIVDECLEEIVKYLVTNTEEKLIWGDLSDEKKRLLLEVSLNRTDSRRDNLVQVIANYTTLGELESGVTKGKILNRFIKK